MVARSKSASKFLIRTKWTKRCKSARVTVAPGEQRMSKEIMSPAAVKRMKAVRVVSIPNCSPLIDV